MDRYQILEDLKKWLADQHRKDGRVPSAYSVTLDKIDALECEHE